MSLPPHGIPESECTFGTCRSQIVSAVRAANTAVARAAKRRGVVMPQKLTLQSIDVRAVSVPLRRPVVSKVGLFKDWPLILIDLQTCEGIVGRSYLEPYLRNAARYV